MGSSLKSPDLGPCKGFCPYNEARSLAILTISSLWDDGGPVNGNSELVSRIACREFETISPVAVLSTVLRGNSSMMPDFMTGTVASASTSVCSTRFGLRAPEANDGGTSERTRFAGAIGLGGWPKTFPAVLF